MTEPPRRLFLLDGHSLAYRAFFALPQTLATSSGTVTNAVYGFTSMLIKLFGDEHPDLLAVAFDMGAPTVRLEMDADYKAGRAETPADFRPQLGLIEEVLDVLHIPVIRMAGHEADDAIGTLATRASAQGLDVVIVTADRDFFQLVRERVDGAGAIGVLFNRRGISEIDRMDPAAVEAKYGVTPAQYLDFVALKGDTSDNIPGVPGVGEKTAAKLVQEFGSVEELLAHTDRLKGKQKENVEAAADRLALNKQLARIVTDVDLDVTPDDCVIGAYDPEQVRGLFTSLEFRSLLDRLYEATGSMKPVAEVAELDLRQASPEQVGTVLAGGDAAVVLRIEDGAIRGVAVSVGGAQASYADLAALGALGTQIADASVSKRTHDAKTLERAITAAGGELSGVTFDTLIGAYLLDPGSTDYGLSAVSERYLGTDLLAGIDEGDGGQLFDEDPWRRTAATAATVGLLVPVIGARADGGSRHPTRRRVPRGDGRGRARPDGDPQGRDLPAGGPGVQPQLAAPAARGALRRARAAAGEEDPEGGAFDRCERVGEAAGRAPDRRCAALVARARQAELHIPGGVAEARRRERARPHDLQPGRGGDRAPEQHQPEPAEHPDPI